MDNVVLGFDDVAGYESDRNQYFGCTVGRVANRTAKGMFTLNGKTYKLAVNNGPNHLHGGGKRSLTKVVWKGSIRKKDNAVVFRYTSPDGEEGYPGKLDVVVTYSINEENGLEITYKAKTNKATPVNLCNHSYFNLSGAGSKTILDHYIMINADKYTPVDETLIPTGKIKSVRNTPLDFRKPRQIGARIKELIDTPTKGYDHNYVLNRKKKGTIHAATVIDPKSGRVLSVATTYPGLQFYSGNFLRGQKGRKGETYPQRSALCLETQYFPNSVNQANFPDIILEPRETYRHTCTYYFLVDKGLDPNIDINFP